MSWGDIPIRKYIPGCDSLLFLVFTHLSQFKKNQKNIFLTSKQQKSRGVNPG
nr:MAG TPA: hypothetical protein [Caudoviricetes sp.]